MSTYTQTVYLITGANRGIGLALVSRIAAKQPEAYIYAGVRDTSDTSSLVEVAARHPGRISTVRCVSYNEECNAALAGQIYTRHGRLDTIIANAGMSNCENLVLNTSASEFERHLAINFMGPVVLFQSMHSLLRGSAQPRFITISDSISSMGGPDMMLPIRSAAYGASKAALNYVTRKLHLENEWLITFPLAPGLVTTDMLKHNASIDPPGVYPKILRECTVRTPEEAAAALIKVIERATRETHGGKFINVDGSQLPW